MVLRPVRLSVSAGKLPLQIVLIVPFVVQLVGTVGLISYFSFQSGHRAVEDLAHQLLEENSDRTLLYLEHYLETPQLINRINRDAVQSGQLDVTNLAELERHLVRQLYQFESVSTILFADPQGNLRGADRMQGVVIVASDGALNGQHYLYQVDEVGNRKALKQTFTMDLGNQRPWYQSAVAAQDATWSPIFPVGTQFDLVVNASRPVYDSTTGELLGVFSVNIALANLNTWLQNLPISHKGRIFVLDHQGRVVASSLAQSRSTIHQPDGSLELIVASSDRIPLLQSAMRQLQAQGRTIDQLSAPMQLEFRYQEEVYFARVVFLNKTNDLKWLVITVMPESEFVGGVKSNLHYTIGLCGVTLLLSIGLGLGFARRFSRTVKELSEGSQRIAQGDFTVALTPRLVREANQIVQAFNQMAQALQRSNQQLQDALQTSQANYRKIFEASPHIIAIVSQTGRYIAVNPCYEQWVGYAAEALVGKSYTEMGLGIDAADLVRLKEHLAVQGRVRNQVVYWHSQGGKQGVMLMSMEPLEMDGQPCWLSVSTEITAQYQAEAALRVSEACNRAVLDAIPDLVLRCTREGDLLEYRAPRGNSAELYLRLEKSVLEVLPPQSATIELAVIQQALDTGEVQTCEVRLLKQGHWAYEEVRASAINEHEVLLIVRDVTEAKQAEIRLQERESLFRSLFEQDVIGVAFTSPTGDYIRVNSRLCHLLGYSEAEFLCLNYRDITHPDDISNSNQINHQLGVNATGSLLLEKRFLHKDGHEIWTSLTLSAIRDEPSMPDLNLALIEDITARKQLELALQASEAKLSDILNSAIACIASFKLGLDGIYKFEYWSAGCEAIYGFTPQELMDDQALWWSHVVPEDLSTVILPTLSALQTQDVLSREYRFRHKNGSIRWIASRLVSRYDPTENGWQVTVVDVDISDRKQTEISLSERETLFRSLFEQDALGVAFTNAAGEYQQVNSRFCSLVGYSEAELLTRSYRDLTHPHDLTESNRVHQWIMDHDSDSVSLEKRYCCKDGREIWVHLTLSSIRHGSDSPDLNLALVQDITARKQLELALQASESKLADILNSAIACIASFRLYVDYVWQYDYWSAGCERIFGFTADELMADANLWWSRVPTEDQQLLLMPSWVNLYAEIPHYREYRFQHKDGSLRWIASYLTSRRDEDQDCWIATVVDIDISDRKRAEDDQQQAEAALQISEARFREIAATINQVFFIRSAATGEFLYVSPAYETIWGLSCQSLYAHASTWMNVIHVEDVSQVQQSLQQLLESEKVSQEYRIFRADDQVRWISAQISVVRDDQNQPLHFIGIAEDITSRKQAEAALRESESRLRTIFDNAQIGIVMMSPPDFKMRLTNPFFQRLLGYTGEELAVMDYADVTYEADLSEDLTDVESFLAGECESFQTEKQLMTKAGEPIWVNLTLSTVNDQYGHIQFTIGLVEDIRERKAVEQLKNEFIGTVSHELRTPLTSMQGALGLLASGIYANKPEKANHMLTIALAESERLARLVNDILNLERLDAGQMVFQMAKCDVATIMERAVNVMETLAQEAGIQLVVYPTTAIVAWADADAVQQTLTNLISNAIKFSDSGGTITLKAEAIADLASAQARQLPLTPLTPPYALLSVADQGRGIPADRLDMIFDRFQQIDASDARQKGGSGLGLAICKRIVQQHGGTIWVESVLHQGSTFYFTLPMPNRDALSA